MTDIAKSAEIVDTAARTATAIAQFTDSAPLGVAEAYQIQAKSIDHRLARGETMAGVKMGLTSRAKMAQVGVHEVIWGRLTDAMRLEEGGALSRKRYVHPRIEPELAYLLKAPLAGEVSAAEALCAVEAIAPAMEIIDSRYRDFKFAAQIAQLLVRDLAEMTAWLAIEHNTVRGHWLILANSSSSAGRIFSCTSFTVKAK